ncbi:MAG: nucleotidyltransferase family protein [Thermoplasmata archaeon]
MRLHDPLDDLLGSRARVRVLRALCNSPGREFSGRELSRLAHVSLTQTQSALEDFLRAGVVLRRAMGRSDQWSLETENRLLPRLIGLFRAEAPLLSNLRREIAASLRRVPVQRAVVFGSVARGEERSESDVDLLIEVANEDDERRALDALLDVRMQAIGRYGVSLHPLVLTPRHRSEINPNVLDGAARDGIPVLEE